MEFIELKVEGGLLRVVVVDDPEYPGVKSLYLDWQKFRRLYWKKLNLKNRKELAWKNLL